MKLDSEQDRKLLMMIIANYPLSGGFDQVAKVCVILEELRQKIAICDFDPDTQIMQSKE
jgi:hypothetical protein